MSNPTVIESSMYAGESVEVDKRLYGYQGVYLTMFYRDEEICLALNPKEVEQLIAALQHHTEDSLMQKKTGRRL